MTARGDGSPAGSVGALVERQVGATPNAIALIDADRPVTYRSLWRRAMAVSGALRGSGLGVEEPVGVALGRNAELVASILGVWHAGGTYVPVDPDDPAPRCAHILRTARCRLLLSDARFAASARALDDAAYDTVYLDPSTLAEPSTPVEPRHGTDASLAYILFTSGSTGNPKGVEIEQRSVVHLLTTMRDRLRVTAADRFLATTSIGFDISIVELLLPLVCGASVLLRHRELWLSPAELVRDIERHAASIVQAVPSAWSTALAVLPEFPRVRVAISTGEAITPRLARQLSRIGSEAWNLYGPTETTIWATARRLPEPINGRDRDDEVPTSGIGSESDAGSSIGTPLAGVDAVVVDVAGRTLPAGRRGELLIGGILLARGYHRQPALTRERFVDHDGQRRYRTGDVASIDADGSIRCFGRADDQVKIRGVRVEPGEVETVLHAHPDIGAAAVTAIAAGEAPPVLVAAYTAAPGRSPSPASLVAWTAARLPAAMVPARWLPVAHLPRTPGGKIDRAAIRAAFQQAAADAPAAPGPALSDTETRIAAIWCRILQRDKVTGEDHFLDIGGDSLAAVKVITSVESTFGIRLGLRSVFGAPTLSALADVVDRALADRHLQAEQSFVFELARVPGSRPIFFSNLDIRMVTQGSWKPPATVYAICNWAQEDVFLQATTIETLARIQLAGIRRHQPTGPYRLAGFAFGGLVALEIASQLRQLGEAVERLILIHPFSPARKSSKTRGAGSRHGAGGWLWRVRAWTSYQFAHRRHRNRDPLAADLLPRHRWPAYWYHARQLARRYVAPPFPGPAVLVAADDPEAERSWRQRLPALQILRTAHGPAADDAGREEWRTLLVRAMENPTVDQSTTSMHSATIVPDQTGR